AVPDRPSQSEPTIGDPAARQRREVNRRCIDADDRARGGSVKTKTALSEGGGHEQNEERSDPVEREPLPHLGEEQCREAERLTEEAPVRGVRSQIVRWQIYRDRCCLRLLEDRLLVDRHARCPIG